MKKIIEIEINNFGNIIVIEKGTIFLKVKRNTVFFDKVFCDYYFNEKLILKTISHQVLPLKTNIHFQDLENKINIKKSLNPWKSNFNINNNKINIIDNPFYLLNKKFSKIYLNDILIGEVFLKNRIGTFIIPRQISTSV